ncbi:TPA: hypothetical protein VER80_001097 [Campylobacter jejuni]|nr:hypothetical protein [Campylobacter jejuni]
MGIWSKICKIRCLGREIFNRKLPAAYIDFSHAMDNMQKMGIIFASKIVSMYAQCVILL